MIHLRKASKPALAPSICSQALSFRMFVPDHFGKTLYDVDRTKFLAE